MRIVFSRRYAIDIGPHVFPTLKYQLTHDRLLAAGLIDESGVVEPGPVSWEQLALVHTPEYLEKMRTGTLTSEEVAQLELPWSQEMVDGFRVMVGGTIRAAELACGLRGASDSSQSPVEDEAGRSARGVVCHIGGGLHHAFANHGEGFCPFNDVAVAVRVVQSRGIRRVAVVDLDVHHGNGTAFIFNPRGADRAGDEDNGVFTFSMHQQHNYPMWKPKGSLDIGLPDGAGDSRFLGELARALPQVMASRPECVFYLAGADPYEGDQLGGLKLTKAGLRQRDRLVIEAVRANAVPLVVTLAGGYAREIEDTVAIHAATIEEALRNAAGPRSGRERF
jgi:acetoin utilization deacetylase AcuC-like enzyme